MFLTRWSLTSVFRLIKKKFLWIILNTCRILTKRRVFCFVWELWPFKVDKFKQNIAKIWKIYQIDWGRYHDLTFLKFKNNPFCMVKHQYWSEKDNSSKIVILSTYRSLSRSKSIYCLYLYLSSIMQIYVINLFI